MSVGLCFPCVSVVPGKEWTPNSVTNEYEWAIMSQLPASNKHKALLFQNLIALVTCDPGFYPPAITTYLQGWIGPVYLRSSQRQLCWNHPNWPLGHHIWLPSNPFFTWQPELFLCVKPAMLPGAPAFSMVPHYALLLCLSLPTILPFHLIGSNLSKMNSNFISSRVLHFPCPLRKNDPSSFCLQRNNDKPSIIFMLLWVTRRQSLYLMDQPFYISIASGMQEVFSNHT